MPRRYVKPETIRRRIAYIVAILILIIAGLSSRKLSFIPEETGDALWAMTLFCFLRALLPAIRLEWIALAALVGSYADEFSQLICWPWLVEVRSTTIGHLLLGQGFLWEDLVAYTLGIALIWLIARGVEKKDRHRPDASVLEEI